LSQKWGQLQTYAGNVTSGGEGISVGLPQVMTNTTMMAGCAVYLRRADGVSLQMNIDPEDSGGVALNRGNLFSSNIPGGQSPFPTGKNPKYSIVVRILSVTKDGTSIVLGVKPYLPLTVRTP